MFHHTSSSLHRSHGSAGRGALVSLLVLGGLAVIVLALLLPRRAARLADARVEAEAAASAGGGGSMGGAGGSAGRAVPRLSQLRGGGGAAETPEAVVADRVTRFSRRQRATVHAMAAHFNIPVPPRVEAFFDVVEGGDWSQIKGDFGALSAQRGTGDDAEALRVLWPAIRDAYSAAEIGASWPAQTLLDYGRAVMDSLGPGTVYVAASEAGRMIPSMFAESRGGEGNVILSQSALEDSAYRDYLAFQHGDRLSGLKREDFTRLFVAQAREAQGRTPPQGQVAGDGQATAQGAGTTEGWNEAVLRMLLEQNPGMSLAVEDLSSLKGLAVDAVPLGPIMELRVGGVDPALIGQRAAQSLEYWRGTAAQLQADVSVPPDSSIRDHYAQKAIAQAAYLADRNQGAQAEEAYRLAHQMAPSSFLPVGQLAEYLARTGRAPEAVALLDGFGRAHEAQTYNVEDLKKKLLAAPAAP